MPSEVEILCFHSVDERLGDAYGHQPQGLLLPLELRSAEGNLFANELVEAALFYQLRALVESAIDSLLQVCELDGLHQVVCRTGRQHLRCGGGIVDGGQHDDRKVLITVSRLWNDLDASHSGHAHITQHEREGFLVQNLERVITGPGDLHLVAAGAEEFAQSEAYGLLVIDDENPGHFLPLL